MQWMLGVSCTCQLFSDLVYCDNRIVCTENYECPIGTVYFWGLYSAVQAIGHLLLYVIGLV